MKKNVIVIVLSFLVITLTDVIADTLILSETVSYTNSKTNETTVKGSIDELFSAVDINNKLGDTTKILTIGDGTVSGAINALNTSLS